MIFRNTISLMMCELGLLALLGCEVPTTAWIESGPTFHLGGSGRLASFTVYGPLPGHRIATPNDEKSQVWSIQRKDFQTSLLVERMELTYGGVPDGYIQTVPPAGRPAALSTGLVYYFFAETTGAPGAEGFFYMDKSGPIRIAVPGLCESGFVGDVKPLKCGTHESYSEPKDLEKFVQENRVR